MPNKEEHKKKMTAEEAGRVDGEKVCQERGPEFYQEVDKKSGETRKEEE